MLARVLDLGQVGVNFEPLSAGFEFLSGYGLYMQSFCLLLAMIRLKLKALELKCYFELNEELTRYFLHSLDGFAFTSDPVSDPNQLA